MTAWSQALVFAAQARARVRLVDGREGVLVYAPGTRSSVNRGDHEPRHRDRRMCGVRFDDTHRVTAVDPAEIKEVMRSGPT